MKVTNCPEMQFQLILNTIFSKFSERAYPLEGLKKIFSPMRSFKKCLEIDFPSKQKILHRTLDAVGSKLKRASSSSSKSFPYFVFFVVVLFSFA